MDRKRKAVSLIEFIIAFAILSFLLLPLLVMHNANTRTVIRTKDWLGASSVALTAMEEAVAKGYWGLRLLLDDVAIKKGDYKVYRPVEYKFSRVVGGTKYNVYVKIGYFPNPNIDGNYPIPPAYKNDPELLAQLLAFYEERDKGRISVKVVIEWGNNKLRRKRFKLIEILPKVAGAVMNH